jgi:ABC-type lipoprotein release transport system permease subunit
MSRLETRKDLRGRQLRGNCETLINYNVGAMDVRALVGVALVVLASALVACYVPARGATKIDPLAALREE